MIISSILHNIYYHKIIKLNMFRFWKEIIIMAVPFSIPWITVLILKQFISCNGLPNIILIGGCFTIIYMVVAYYFCMNEYEKGIILKPIEKYKRRRKNVFNY